MLLFVINVINLRDMCEAGPEFFWQLLTALPPPPRVSIGGGSKGDTQIPPWGKAGVVDRDGVRVPTGLPRGSRFWEFKQQLGRTLDLVGPKLGRNW